MMNGKMNKGMRNCSPSATDASTKLPGKNIDKDSTRSGVAKQPRQLGPRSA
jgi:hypothetical protein